LTRGTCSISSDVIARQYVTLKHFEKVSAIREKMIWCNIA